MRGLRTVCGGVALLGAALISDVAEAQVVRGTVRESVRQPLAGVVVTLLDSTNAPLVRVLSDSVGGFRLLTTRTGTFRLRAQRVGYLPTVSAPFVVDRGETVTQALVFEGGPTQLRAVRVAARSSCGRVDGGDAQLLAVWEQAHTMLTASLLTSGTRGLTTSTLRVRRVLDPGGKVLEQDLGVHTANFTAPWASLPIDTLRTRGYVWADADNQLTYNAPGIDGLVSPRFLDDHCFRLVAARDPAEIGVAFEPVPHRARLSELRGIFWVERASAELRRAEFRYTNVDEPSAGPRASPPSFDDPRVGGGTMRFVRLPGGMVLIERWELRMPVLTREIFAGRTRTRLDMTETVGGMLLAIHRGRDTLFVRPRMVVRGMARDSVSGRPLVDARIRLLGTTYSATSGPDGRFVLADVLPGAYTMAVSTAMHDSLGLANGEALVVRDSMPDVMVRVPTAYQLAETLCGGTFAAASRSSRGTRGALFGRVTVFGDTTGLVDAPVAVDWVDTIVDTRRIARGEFRVEARRLSTKTDGAGWYRLCGVPFDVGLTVRVLTTEGRAVANPARVTRTRQLVAIPLQVDRSRPATATLSGTVVSAASGQPIVDAEVMVSGVERSVRTDSAGQFRIDGIPAGEQELAVRRLGFESMRAPLSFAANDQEERRVVLGALTTLDSVNVTADRVPHRLIEFEENRRVGLGKFLDRAELERMDAFPLSSTLGVMSGMSQVAGRYALSTRYVAPLRTANECLPWDLEKDRPKTEVMYNPSKRERASGIACACYARVYLDGVLMNPGQPTEPFDLRQVQTSDLEAVEWYSGASQLPVQFLRREANCGVLVLHRRQWQ